MNNHDPLDQPGRASLSRAVWPIEKLRIWFNFILGLVAAIPMAFQVTSNIAYFNAWHRIKELMAEVGFSFLGSFLLYNVIFCFLYFAESSHLKKTSQLLKPAERARVFRIVLGVCLIHLIIKLYNSVEFF